MPNIPAATEHRKLCQLQYAIKKYIHTRIQRQVAQRSHLYNNVNMQSILQNSSIGSLAVYLFS